MPNYRPIHTSTVTFVPNVIADSTLEVLARRYFTTEQAIFHHNRDRLSSLPRADRVATLEEFRNVYQNGGIVHPIRIPVPLEERSMDWKQIECDGNTGLEELCRSENARRQAMGVDPVVPAFLWNLARNAPLRMSVLEEQPRPLASDYTRGQQLVRATDHEPGNAIPPRGQTLFVPKLRGVLQTQINALPLGSVAVQSFPAEFMDVVREFEIIENLLAQVEHNNLGKDIIAGDLAQYCNGLMVLDGVVQECLRGFSASPIDTSALDTTNTLARRSLEQARDAIRTASHDVTEPMRLGLNSMRPRSIVAMEEDYANALVRRIQNTPPEIAQLLVRMVQEQNQYLIVPGIIDWICAVADRAIIALRGNESAERWLDEAHSVFESNSSSIIATSNICLKAFSIMWTIGGNFFGNAPGPANFCLSVFQAITLRNLSKFTLPINSRVSPPVFAQRVSRALLDRAEHLTDATKNEIIEKIRTGSRSDLEAAAREIEGNLHRGVYYRSLVCLFAILSACSAIENFHTDTSNPSDFFGASLATSNTVVAGADALEGVLGAIVRKATGQSIPVTDVLVADPVAEASMRGMSRTVRIVQSTRNGLGFFAEVSGRALAILATILAAYQLWEYMDTTAPESRNKLKILSLVLGLLGSIVTTAAFFCTIPYGQLVGTTIIVASIVVGIVAEPEETLQMWQGPVRAVLGNVVKYLKNHEFPRNLNATARQTLESAIRRIEIAIGNVSGISLATPRNAEEERLSLERFSKLGFSEREVQSLRSTTVQGFLHWLLATARLASYTSIPHASPVARTIAVLSDMILRSSGQHGY